MISNKDLRVEGSNIIINGEKHPLDPAVIALTKRANIVQGKFSALDTKLDAIEALEKSASGNPISITGAAAAYAMSNIMTIEPIQSGSGDPSPTNVRPISGISTASVQTTDGTDTNTATITLGQTVYGGSVNFKTGEVTVTHGMVDLGTLTYAYDNRHIRFISPVSGMKSVDDWGAISVFCSQYKKQSMAPGQTENNTFGTYGNSVYIRDTSYTDATAFKTAMSGVQLCYELETPITLTLTPAELELLKGANTISGNGVNINLSYIGR
jgi:hypothetical protein